MENHHPAADEVTNKTTMKDKKAIDSTVPWASLSPEARKARLAERKRTGSRLRMMAALMILLMLILPNFAGEFEMGLSLLPASVYFIYYARELKRHGVSFFRTFHGTITKRNNPVLFQVELFSSYMLAILLFIVGMYLIGES